MIDVEVELAVIKHRVYVLECKFAEMDKFPHDNLCEPKTPALEHPQDAKPQGREWVNYADAIWAYWNDGEVTLTSLGILADADMHKLIAIMPCSSDKKPDAPEATK